MTIFNSDSTVPAMNKKFRALIPTYLPTLGYSLLLGFEMTAGPACSTALHIPTAFWIVYYMMGMRFLRHGNSPYLLI
jgi:hypothetical protein